MLSFLGTRTPSLQVTKLPFIFACKIRNNSVLIVLSPQIPTACWTTYLSPKVEFHQHYWYKKIEARV